MILLYDKDECPFCWRVRMALHAAGVEYERRAHDDPSWSAVWPTLTRFGTVPVLVDGPLILTDSRTILEYLDEVHGGLWPKTPPDRARARERLCHVDGILGPPARDLVFEMRDKAEPERDRQLIDDAISRWREALPLLSENARRE